MAGLLNTAAGTIPADPSASVAGRTLRVQVVSDLHVDIVDTRQLRLAPGADLVAVVGDTRAGAASAFAYLRRHIPAPIPIVAVLGNHEFYGSAIESGLGRAREAAGCLGITLLEDEAAVIAGVRFLGATLWTDYALFGPAHRAVAMAAARRGMNDHRLISVGRGPERRPFLPGDAAILHAASVRFLDATLAVPFDGPSVVVTHHAPHPVCIAPRFGRDPLGAAFASDLSALIDTRRPDVWISGHTHHPVDTCLGPTRLVSNPHGYRDECRGTFDPAFVVEIPVTPRMEDLT
ncbi:metallophosphoesterase [Methylobacterium bullatum]|uniref:3',5'-cyclic adenosine monophosphate phosphodiesterase CpdA n=1 Tax=Methylobacterium bullatum TaxID=570505 RepID=A0A679JKH6_9HYPH|nr:3',5'-cyclic adenosine monophosphate phosphodiesterase CpdA [Methylobacterium bullatum]